MRCLAWGAAALALQLSWAMRQGVRERQPPPEAGPARVASRWRECKAWAKDVPHQVDAVASSKVGSFLYVDNVKAGSTSVRNMLSKVLQADWYHSDISFADWWRADGCWDKNGRERTSSKSFPAEDLEPLLHFSIVRDPVAKFESGVREAWAQKPHLRNLTADEMLDRQLELARNLRELGQSCQGFWLNEHLQPSSWRLSASTTLGRVGYDFIAKVESFEEDWREIVKAMSHISPQQRQRLLLMGHANTRKHDNRSKLSPEGIRRMCDSWVYGSEWECFGYPRPAECA